MQIVEKYYSGKNAHSYNQTRVGNSKWKAEQQYVENFIRSNDDIKTVIDAPAGTGRFHSVVETSFHVEKAYGYELSDDMLAQARFTNTRKWDYVRLDLINENIPVKGDLTVCIRMLNLINEEDALAITRNIQILSGDVLRHLCMLAVSEFKRQGHLKAALPLQFQVRLSLQSTGIFPIVASFGKTTLLVEEQMKAISAHGSKSKGSGRYLFLLIFS